MRLRYHLLAFALAAAWFVATPNGASAAGCRAPDDAGDFEVVVDIDVREPDVSNHLSKAQLGSSSAHGRRGQILGTTQSGLELRWFINYQVSEWRNVYCFWVASAVRQ